MRKITIKGALSFLLLSACFLGYGQQVKNSEQVVPEHRKCGLDKHEQAMLNNPEYRASFYERKARFDEKLLEIHKLVLPT